MAKNFVMLSKELMESEDYFAERFTRMQAYFDLCLLASYKERKFVKRGIVVELKQGQLAKSEEELAERWKWSRNTVRKYLNEQQNIGNIEQQKSRLITIITVKFGIELAQQIEQQKTPIPAQQIEQQIEQQQEYNIEEIIKENKRLKEELTKVSEKKTTEYSAEFEKDFILYQRKGSKKNAYKRWKELSDEDKENMRRHIPYYIQSNDRQFLKDFEGYINQRTFETPVYRGNVLLYEPMQVELPDEYHPVTDGIFSWWDGKVVHISNGDIKRFDDGYTDDKRPDGATVSWGMYSWKWSRANMEWVKQ